MTASFTGLYIQQLGTDTLNQVHILDADGIEHSIGVNEYTQRGIRPPIEKLRARKPISTSQRFMLTLLAVGLLIAVTLGVLALQIQPIML